MRNQGQLIFGGVLVLLGVLSLLSTLFNVNLWAFCWPVGFIVLGAWLVFRPRMVAPGWETDMTFIGERKRTGNWPVRNEEFWMGVGDLDLDLTQASLPPGETTLRVRTFVSDVDIKVPSSIGVSIHVNGFVIEAKLLGQRYQQFFAPVDLASPNYAACDSKVHIDMIGFVSDLNVNQV